jgi:hypothetical protein
MTIVVCDMQSKDATA